MSFLTKEEFYTEFVCSDSEAYGCHEILAKICFEEELRLFTVSVKGKRSKQIGWRIKTLEEALEVAKSKISKLNYYPHVKVVIENGYKKYFFDPNNFKFLGEHTK